MSKDTIVSEYYCKGNQLYKSEESNFQIDNEEFQLYEVMRCNNGRLIFESDHLARLEKGLKHIGYNSIFPAAQTSEMLRMLVKANNCASGNVKLYASFSEGELKFAACFVPHNYPPGNLYRNGVKLKSFQIERNDPSIKQLAVSLKIQSSLGERMGKSFYEALLIDNEGNITEGSKSNFFLIKNNELYSAPEELILAGITRNYVLRIAEKLRIPIHLQKIQITDLHNFQAAFICGTSPKVLPVKKINTLSLNPGHSLILKLLSEYNLILQDQAGQ